MKKPVLGITLDSMWSIKDYILSGALKAIGEDFELMAWVPAGFLDGVRQLAARSGVKMAVEPFLSFEPNPVFSSVCKLQKSLLYERYDVETERINQRRRGGAGITYVRSPLAHRVSSIMRVVAKSRFAGAADLALQVLRRHSTPSGLYVNSFAANHVDALFCTNPIKRDEDPVYYEAKRRRLPTASLVLSWDNLTSKGVIHRRFDRIMVWNEVMREEVLGMYPEYRPSQVDIVGFPRFDIYLRPFPEEFQRASFLGRLGLDPSRAVILFASSGIRGYPTQIQVLQHVLAARDGGVFGGGTQVLVRCHPHDPLEPFKAFRGIPDTAVWPESRRGDKGTLFEQIPDPDELLVLGASIAHSAVVVTAGSSVTLDAARCDVPVVCIAYDGDTVLPIEDSFQTVYDYSHQRPLHAIGGTTVCRSRDELIAAVKTALKDPREKAPGRATIVERYLGGRTSSIERVCRSLRQVAGLPMRAQARDAQETCAVGIP
jgi:hypothetical protein